MDDYTLHYGDRPIDAANMLIDSGFFDEYDLHEIAGYLEVWCHSQWDRKRGQEK